MAEETVPELENDSERIDSAAEDMDLETLGHAQDSKGDDACPVGNGADAEPPTNGDANTKRAREEEDEGVPKKQKVEKSVEEARLEKLGGDGDEEGNEGSGCVDLGPKKFGSSVEMFDYFYKFLHAWPTNVNINKYEHMVILDLLNKGHAEPDKKIGGGIHAFQVRFHPTWKSRCFFLVRNDESSDDFSFRKCVDHILPLPEHMKIKANANKALGGKGRGGGGGRGRGRGRGRGGKSRY